MNNRPSLRPGLLICLAVLSCCLGAQAGCDGFIKGFVQDETGFDGAVTVLEASRDGAYGVVTVRMPFLDIYGKAREGRARLVLHRNRVNQAEPLPAFCHVHYEMGVDGAKKWAKRGWAVFTAVYNEEAPIAVSMGDGNNQARAIIEWARRCPFIDRARFHLDGGSQGGYMALAMSADMFPITSTTADVPVVNWAYNFAYFEANRPLTTGYANPGASPLPVLAMVTSLADMSYEHFPRDLSHDAWYFMSPISQVERITDPTLITSSTGDMLVPMEQVTQDRLHPCDPAKFPQGYARDFDLLAPSDNTRVRFMDLLPRDQVFSTVLPLQQHSYLVTTAMRLDKEPRPGQKPRAEDRPWSRDHQWNFCFLDEGPPEPFADHTTWAWDTVPDSFVDHYRNAAPAPALLNAAKLERLLERYTGAMTRLPALKDGTLANRRNFDYLEKRDVLEGLAAYASLGAPHAERLAALYAASAEKPFGQELTAEVLKHALAELAP